MPKWFHTRLQEARERAGLTQTELADKLDVSSPTISNWENRVSEPRGEQRAIVLNWIESSENGSKRRRARDQSTEEDDDESEDEANALESLRKIYTQWPQSRIAEALSVSQATVSNWLRTGSVSSKYLSALRRLEKDLTQSKKEQGDGTGVAEDTRTEDTAYADWLRAELERQETNAVELAEKSGVHINTILYLLEGRTEKPQQRTRQRIEKALRVGDSPSVGADTDQDPWYYIGLAWTNEEIEQVPDEPGVYIIHDRLGRPAYIGVAHKGAGGIRARLRKHNELRWTSDRRVAHSFSYALASRMPSSDASQLAKSLEKLLIKFMGNAILINEKDVEDIAD